MTNGMDMIPPTCGPTRGDGDLWPLFWVVVVLLAGRIAFKGFQRRKGKPGMKNSKNMTIVAAVAVAVAAVFALKHRPDRPVEPAPAAAEAPGRAMPDAASPAIPAGRPRLLELGADKCTSCKLMTPILADLKTAYAGQLQVDFIDVWKDESAGETYGVRVIPLQIFFDAHGQELFRHIGFFAKEDILAKWKELGFDFE